MQGRVVVDRAWGCAVIIILAGLIWLLFGIYDVRGEPIRDVIVNLRPGLFAGAVGVLFILVGIGSVA